MQRIGVGIANVAELPPTKASNGQGVSSRTTDQKIIKARVGLVELARQLGNVSETCKVMGYSRDTFYRYEEMYENSGDEALKDLTRRRKPLLKNRVAREVEEAVREMAMEPAAHGQVRVSNELRKKGIFVSSDGVCAIWLRQDVETMKKRL